MHRRAWVAVAACVTVAACSSSSGKPAPKAGSSATSSGGGADVSVHVSLKKPLTLTLDAAANLSPGTSATFYGYQQPVSVGRSLDAVAQGFVFGVADVKVCVGSKPDALGKSALALVDRKSFVLHYANGTVIDPAAIQYPKEPTPVFPFAVWIRSANTCIRGKIVYPVPRSSRPESIVYAPSGFAGTLTFRFS